VIVWIVTYHAVPSDGYIFIWYKVTECFTVYILAAYVVPLITSITSYCYVIPCYPDNMRLLSILIILMSTTYKLCFTQNKEATVCSLAIDESENDTNCNIMITHALMQTVKERTKRLIALLSHVTGWSQVPHG
jgi:hypothetical protein